MPNNITQPLLSERDPSKPAEQQGIFRKFDVRRVDECAQPGGKHDGCRYFVLDLNHDRLIRVSAQQADDSQPAVGVDGHGDSA